jgi:hypothetical protein
MSFITFDNIKINFTLPDQSDLKFVAAIQHTEDNQIIRNTFAVFLASKEEI